MTGPAVQTDPLEALKALKASSAAPDPLDALKALKRGDADPMAKWHAAYQSGALGEDMATKNAKDAADASQTPMAQKVAETLVSGLPGGNRAVSGYRGLLSLMGVGDDTPDEAMAQQRTDVASMPLKARVPLQLAGGAPAAALAAPLGLVGGGAILGAAYGADAPAETLGEWATNTAIGGATGAAASKLAGMMGAGIANLSNRTGLTDKIAGVVSKFSPEAAAAIGARGQVNTALADRQDILNHLSDNGVSAGKVQLDRIAATKAKAVELYDIARADQQTITDPRVQELLKDPDVAKTFETVKALRAAKGNPVPEVNNLAAPPQAQMNKLIRPEDWQRMMQNPANQAALQQLPTGLSGLTTEAMPDPEALSMMKRYLGDASQGLNSPLDMKQDKAIATLDKMRQLRDVLHDISPAYKEADAFYANAKGQEEAFANGFDAFRHASNPSGQQLPSHSADAMLQKITTPRYADEPTDAMAQRAEAFRSGVKAAMAAAVKGAPVDRNLRSVMKAPSLAGDQTTQGIRALGFEPQIWRGAMGTSTAVPSPQSNALEQLLATQRGTMLESPSPRGLNDGDIAHRSGRIRAAIRSLTQAPDAIATPAGQQLLAARQSDPGLMTSEIAKQKAGETALQYLARLAALSTGNMVGARPRTP